MVISPGRPPASELAAGGSCQTAREYNVAPLMGKARFFYTDPVTTRGAEEYTMAGISPLTRIKIEELQRQRDRLHAHYQGIEERARQTSDPAQRLRILAEGLRAAHFAQTPLHPDIDN